MDDYTRHGKRSDFSMNDVAQFLVVLLVAKFFKSCGIYMVYDLLKHIHVVQLLFFATVTASAVFILLQKPFSAANSGYESVQGPVSKSKRITQLQYIKLFKYSFIQTAVRLVWLFGLSQCGPLRTTLIFEQSESIC